MRVQRPAHPRRRQRRAHAAAGAPRGGAQALGVLAAAFAALAAGHGALAREGPDSEFYFEASQYAAIEGVTLTGAALSMLGSGFIVFSYFYFPDLRTFPYKLICFLSCADFLGSLSYFVDINGDYLIELTPGPTCYLAAGMSEFFDCATFFWTAVIAFNIHQVLAQGKGRTVERYEIYYHLVAWGVPAVFLIIAIVADAFGDAGNWCWITAEHQGLRFALYYIPLICVFIWNGALFYRISKSIRRLTTQASAVEMRLRLYLLVFFLVRVWSVVNRIQNVLAPDSPSFVLFMLHSMFSPVQGFANSMVYGFNQKVVRRYRQLLARVCPCCSRRRDTPNPLASPGLPSSSGPEARKVALEKQEAAAKREEDAAAAREAAESKGDDGGDDTRV